MGGASALHSKCGNSLAVSSLQSKSSFVTCIMFINKGFCRTLDYHVLLLFWAAKHTWIQIKTDHQIIQIATSILLKYVLLGKGRLLRTLASWNLWAQDRGAQWNCEGYQGPTQTLKGTARLCSPQPATHTHFESYWHGIVFMNYYEYYYEL